MKLSSTIERRLLVNWRADPDVVQALLPAPLRPTLVASYANVGVCLVRLRDARPRRLPVPGASSEGAAHRVGVEWDTGSGVERGVFIWRRHTGSLVNRLLGGRLFPGVHHAASFAVTDSGTQLAITVDDVIDVAVSSSDVFTSGAFVDLDDASRYFEQAPLGISPSRDGSLEAMRLVTRTWSVAPVHIEDAHSEFYSGPRVFPTGLVTLDSALLMSDIAATWSPDALALQR